MQIVTSRVDNTILGYNDTVKHLFAEADPHRVIMVHIGSGYFFEPSVLRDVLDCLPMNHYYWWRAVSTAFLLRPNDVTLTWLVRHLFRFLHVGAAEFSCLGLNFFLSQILCFRIVGIVLPTIWKKILLLLLIGFLFFK